MTTTPTLPDVPESLADALSRAWEYATAKGLPAVDLALVRAIARRQRIRDGRSRLRPAGDDVEALPAAPAYDDGAPMADILANLPPERKAAFDRSAAAYFAREGKARADWSAAEANAIRDCRRALAV